MVTLGTNLGVNLDNNLAYLKITDTLAFIYIDVLKTNNIRFEKNEYYYVIKNNYIKYTTAVTGLSFINVYLYLASVLLSFFCWSTFLPTQSLNQQDQLV